MQNKGDKGERKYSDKFIPICMSQQTTSSS